MDNSTKERPVINEITDKIRNVTYEMDQEWVSTNVKNI